MPKLGMPYPMRHSLAKSVHQHISALFHAADVILKKINICGAIRACAARPADTDYTVIQRKAGDEGSYP